MVDRRRDGNEPNVTDDECSLAPCGRRTSARPRVTHSVFELESGSIGEEAVRVHLGGHLSWYDQGKRSWLELDPQTVLACSRDGLSGRLTPAALAQRLALPRGEIAMVAVNGHTVDLDGVSLADGDRVEFYPPIGGG